MATSERVAFAIFYLMMIAGQIILITSLITVVVARLPRDLHLISAALSMLIYSTASSLLLYANVYRGPEPPFGLCLAQASIIYGSLAMAASAILCLFFQLWDALRRTFSGTMKPRTALKTSLKVLPWSLLISMSLGCLFDGIRHPSEVLRSRDFFYCSGSRTMSHVFNIVSGSCMAIALLFEVHIFYMVAYMWRGPTHKRELLPIGSILRMALFSVYCLFSVAVMIFVIFSPPGGLPRSPFLVLSTLPIAVWLTFWTQKDVFRVWASCIPRRTMGKKEALNDV